MAEFVIPPELIEMLRARRVIPFVGAGFSAPFQLPDWDTLLSKLAGELEGVLPYEKVKEFCAGNQLQIAEYYLLLCDGSIGPIRHAITNGLRTSIDPIQSSSHIELVNLGAPQIYTTNY